MLETEEVKKKCVKHIFALRIFINLNRELSSRSAAHWSWAVAHRPLLAETSSVALAGVYRFQLRLLSRRDEVSVFL